MDLSQSSDSKTDSGIWRYSSGMWPNTLAIAYVFVAQGLGLAGIVADSLVINIGASLLIAHSLVVAAYLIHELAHALVFNARRHNRLLGEILLWICGAGYASFERVRWMHLRHHSDRADVACFDHQAFLRKAPRWLKKLIYAAEWCHIPAVELVMHYQVIYRPFIDKSVATERKRVIVMLLTRGAFFVLLMSISLPAIVFYAFAYLLFIKALFLADAYAHTYEIFIVAHNKEPVEKNGRDAEYDRHHTYSNLYSTRWPWLNLLNLNFGYHNAHHDRPATPWYRLPQMQWQLYDKESPQVLPYRELWRSVHKNRLACILTDDFGDVSKGPGRADGFLGVHGVSFLSIV